MNVPVFNKTVSIQDPGVATPHIAPITEAASGANVAEAQAGLGKTISAVGGALAEHLIAKNNIEKEQASNAVISAFAKEGGEKFIYGKNGVLNRFGVNAKGATEYADIELSKLQSKYLEGMDTESADHFKRKSTAIIDTWREASIKNEVHEGRIADEQSVNASIQTSANVSAADGLNTPSSQALFNTALSEARDLSARQGMTKEAIDLYQKKVAGAYIETVIDANINKGDIARQALTFAKDKLAPETYKALDIKISANEFTKAVIVGKSQGMGLNEVITKYADSPAFNRNDEETKAELYSIARKAYAVTDYHTYNSLADGIEAGTIKQEDIDRNFDAGAIIQSDAEALSTRLRNANTGEGDGKLSPAMKLSVDGLKLKAAEIFKTKQEEDEFMFVVNKEAHKNTTPEQLYKKGIDLMGMVEIPTAHWWNNDDFPGYKVELERERATDIVRANKMEDAAKYLDEIKQPKTPANIAAVIAWKERQVKK